MQGAGSSRQHHPAATAGVLARQHTWKFISNDSFLVEDIYCGVRHDLYKQLVRSIDWSLPLVRCLPPCTAPHMQLFGALQQPGIRQRSSFSVLYADDMRIRDSGRCVVSAGEGKRVLFKELDRAWQFFISVL